MATWLWQKIDSWPALLKLARLGRSEHPQVCLKIGSHKIQWIQWLENIHFALEAIGSPSPFWTWVRFRYLPELDQSSWAQGVYQIAFDCFCLWMFDVHPSKTCFFCFWYVLTHTQLLLVNINVIPFFVVLISKTYAWYLITLPWYPSRTYRQRRTTLAGNPSNYSMCWMHWS